MNTFFKAISILTLSLLGTVIHAQQDAQYTQYMYNTININPAYAGTRDVLSIVALHRNQWVGIDGAPQTGTLSINTPITSDKKLGLGVSLVHDDIEPSKEVYGTIDVSYRIDVSDNAKLSFGLKGGVNWLNSSLTRLELMNNQNAASGNGDAAFSQNINMLQPNIGAGVYYYTDKTYFGLSVPNFLQSDHFDSVQDANQNVRTVLSEERMHFYGILGHVFTLSNNVKLKPAGLVKMVLGAPLQVDASLNALLFDTLTIGAAYRWDAAISGLIGVNINKNLMFGFAYDREITELGNTDLNIGSFEFMLRYDVRRQFKPLISPRFF